jgi:hypothetical protein
VETPDKESIIVDIIREEEFLTKIADEQKQALSRIKNLREKLTSLKTTEQVRESPAQLIKSTLSPKTSEDKVALFRPESIPPRHNKRASLLFSQYNLPDKQADLVNFHHWTTSQKISAVSYCIDMATFTVNPAIAAPLRSTALKLAV